MVATAFSTDVHHFASLPHLDNNDIINSSLFKDLSTVYMYSNCSCNGKHRELNEYLYFRKYLEISYVAYP